jgi:hypothetical protein
MATALKLRRGTTSQHSTFTGAEGEVTVDTTKDTVVVHDGATAGGFPLATEKGANTFTANQIISVTDNTNAALRITQAGTGNALLVEDSANPDSTPFVIKNDGKVGIGTSSPDNALDVVATEPFVKISTASSGLSAFYQATTPIGSLYLGKDRDGSAGLFGNAGEYVIAGTGNYPMDFWTNSVKRATITGDGDFVLGATDTSGSSLYDKVRIVGTTGQNSSISLFRYSADNGPTNLRFYKSRSASVGGFAAVQSGDLLGQIQFQGTDGTNWNGGGTSARIVSYVDGAVSTNIIPAAILFGTMTSAGALTTQAEIRANGDFQMNSGYGSVATAYGCRAWVNFDGTSNATNLTGTYSQTGTTVTVTITDHGYITGNSAFLDFTSGTAVDGAYTVTVTDANTFTVTQASRTTSGNVTNRRSNIRGSGNVSSVSDNGAGDYSVNFITAMPDANYSVSVMQSFNLTGAPTTGYGSSAYAVNTTSCRISVWGSVSSNRLDVESCSVQIFR